MFKKINLVLFVLTVVTFLSIRFFWKEYCPELECSLETIVNTIKPLMNSSLAFAFSFLLALSLNEKLNKYWLVGLCWWLYPLLYIDAISFRMGVFGSNPGLNVWFTGGLFFIITFLFATAWYLWWYKKGEVTKKELSKLLFVIPIGVIFYFARDIFFW